jgi:hypothetical protein
MSRKSAAYQRLKKFLFPFFFILSQQGITNLMFMEKVTGWGFSGGRSWLRAPEHARLMADLRANTQDSLKNYFE